MDPLDERIVGALVRNGRASYASIGHEIGLSAHAVADRVRRLQRSGAIKGFTALLGPASSESRLEAIVQVRVRPGVSADRFERIAATLPGVREISFLAGRCDFELRLLCRDSDQLDETVRALRGSVGAATTETHIILRKAMPPAVDR